MKRYLLLIIIWVNAVVCQQPAVMQANNWQQSSSSTNINPAAIASGIAGCVYSVINFFILFSYALQN